jgi:outer membrane protein assembly factor BamB
MKRMVCIRFVYRGMVILFLLMPSLFLVARSSGRADDWPQWLGPERDDVWRESGIMDRFPEGGPPRRWRMAIGPGYTGPAVAGGRVYVMDHLLAQGTKLPQNAFQAASLPGQERVLCLNEGDGQMVWKHAYDCPYKVSYGSGPRTTPLVKEGKVYTVGTMGDLHCLAVDDGKLLWSHDFKKDYGAKVPMWGFAAHPLIDGKKLICLVGGPGSAVVALDKDTGKEIWKALTCKELGYCPPMIYQAGSQRQLIVWHGEAVNGLDPDTGKVYWSQPMTTYMGMAISTPRKLGDLLFVTSTYNHSAMLRLDETHPAAKIAWLGDKKTSFDSVFGTPFLEDGYIYGTAADGEFRCVKMDSGQRVWSTFKPNGGKKAQCGDVFIVKNGDRFFLFTDQGDLIIARLSPTGYDEISRAHLIDATGDAFGRPVVWSHPAFADRCIFVRNDKEIACFSLAASMARLPGGN